MIESELLSIKVFLARVTLNIDQGKYFFIDSALETNPWTYKIKNLNRKKN